MDAGQRVAAILAAAGQGTRIGGPVPKQLLKIGARTILQRSFDVLERHEQVHEVIVALPSELAKAPPAFLTSADKAVRIVDGGARRQDSVANAFEQVSSSTGLIVIHDAARPFASPELFSRVIEAAHAGGAAIAAVRASDTVKETKTDPGFRAVVRTIARDAIYLAQTPQAFAREVLQAAVALGQRESGTATDEASLAEAAGYSVRIVEGEASNIKVTTEQDLKVSHALAAIQDRRSGGPSAIRVGTGYDLHRLEPDKPLIIGGVRIAYDTGLAGHSDADVLCHAVTDALLGAVASGDIGQHFPDTDPRWKNANSIELLERAAAMVREAGYAVSNVDAVVIAERPKLLPHIPQMRANLADALEVDVSAVSIKAKTNEKVDAVGRNEAIAVHAIALVRSL